MATDTFSPPGNVDDLTPAGRHAWSRTVDSEFTRHAEGHPRFINPAGIDLTQVGHKEMRWGAFPRKLARVAGPAKWQRAEDRARQEEYCEWAAHKDRHGRIIRAWFTTEFGLYYHQLAADDPERLLNVYRQHISEDVQLRDLVSGSGRYREDNEWNLRAAMHMVQRNNTLQAAMLLVAQATVVRTSADGLITNANELIRCGIDADPDRNSDPLIVGDVNTLARTGARITLDVPVGIYLESLQTTGWTAPKGNDASPADPASFWQITRGNANHGVRAVYEVPAEHGYTVSDITINGEPISSPSQIAQFIEVKITGVADTAGAVAPEPVPCPETAGRLEAIRDDLPLATELEATARHSR